jgi:DNA-binding response OmpR family regulator
MFTVLVVEDDRDLRKMICNVLSKDGYKCIEASDGKSALEFFDKECVDLVISDVMMPNLNGYELAETLRAANIMIPFLMVTAKGSFDDKKRGFSAGTDDYMVKPINIDELVLRVGALLKRAKIASDHKITVGDFEMNYDNYSVLYNGETIILPQKEFMLLFKLLSYPDKIFTHFQLLDELWGMETDSDERTVYVHINRLRERFKDCPHFDIVTVRGLGYKVVKK